MLRFDRQMPTFSQIGKLQTNWKAKIMTNIWVFMCM